MASKELPRGVRNNNPTNLVHVDENKWQGLAQPPSDGKFCVFLDMPSGIRANVLNLIGYQDRYGLRTIKELVSKWAPWSENDVEAYIETVCLVSGFAEDQVLDLHTYEHLQPVYRGMMRQEVGRAGAELVTAAQLDEGLRRAGVVPVRKAAAKDPQISLNTISATTGTVATTIAATEPAWNTLAKIHPNLPIIAVCVLGGISIVAALFFVARRFLDRRQGVA